MKIRGLTRWFSLGWVTDVCTSGYNVSKKNDFLIVIEQKYVEPVSKIPTNWVGGGGGGGGLIYLASSATVASIKSVCICEYRAQLCYLRICFLITLKTVTNQCRRLI